MGLVSSAFSILGTVSRDTTTTTETTDKDGNVVRTIEVNKGNPFVNTLLILSTTTILLCYLDDGQGTLTRIFSKACLDCQKRLLAPKSSPLILTS